MRSPVTKGGVAGVMHVQSSGRHTPPPLSPELNSAAWCAGNAAGIMN